MSATECANQQEPNQNWGSNFPNSPSSSVFKCRSYKSSFDWRLLSECSLVYVRDTDGLKLLKGSRGSNLFSISVEDMMKSFPICLLSKASKNNSMVLASAFEHWKLGYQSMFLHEKDLVRGLPRMMRILENYNQRLILESLLVTHQTGRVTESTTNGPINDGGTIHAKFTFDELSEQMAPVTIQFRTATNMSSVSMLLNSEAFGKVHTSSPLDTSFLFEYIMCVAGGSSIPTVQSRRKTFQSAATEDCWFQAMQDEIHEFDRLDVWELVPPPDSAMIIALKWIYKVKLDEYGDVLKNKARLVAKDLVKRKAHIKALEEVNRVLSVFQGSINMVSWYRKDNAMALTAYAAQIMRLSGHSRSYLASDLFLGDKLVSMVIKEANQQRPYRLRGSMANAEQAPAMASPVRTDEQISAPTHRGFDSKAGSYTVSTDGAMVLISIKTHSGCSSITPVDQQRAFFLLNSDTPWELATIINLCLTGKTSGFERPRAPVLQILWGVVNQAHIDYAERMWEEFTQSIQH
ncbi:retrovirus-related pol polyprotein from transposon TNT 1-94 [Tanacetum coccineum]|uniref:Retrovirus-related pol polyprotein from transposon TNT 1-94 n=1 Tax=Tanacetum coccineum TaxID=301880 RepID=A0ABQ4WKM4_9ASTR